MNYHQVEKMRSCAAEKNVADKGTTRLPIVIIYRSKEYEWQMK